MNKKALLVYVAALVILPIAFFGCKGKVEKMDETPESMTEGVMMEPAQTVATETIPPTATPPAMTKPMSLVQTQADRNKDIQKALANAGLYTGPIDGKIGPKTKSAIIEFQKSKGLKADGKVGSKTWAELEKHLTQQQ